MCVPTTTIPCSRVGCEALVEIPCLAGEYPCSECGSVTKVTFRSDKEIDEALADFVEMIQKA